MIVPRIACYRIWEYMSNDRHAGHRIKELENVCWLRYSSFYNLHVKEDDHYITMTSEAITAFVTVLKI